MMPAAPMTTEEIRAECERKADAERVQFCQDDEPEPPDEPGAPGTGRFPSSYVLKCLGKNQIGDAEIFKHLHRGKFLFDYATGAWFKWTGHYWQQDKVEYVVSAMQAVCRVYEIELQRVSWRVNQERGKKDAK